MLLQEQPPEPTHHARQRRKRHLGLWIALLVLLAALTVPAASYLQAMVSPGEADWQVRTVEWIRDHGGGPVVDAAENWWYSRNRPSGAAPAPGTLPLPAAGPAPVTPQGPRPPSLPLLPGVAPLPGEATWVPSSQTVGAAPALHTGYFRPDPAYPSVIVGVAWMNQEAVSTRLVSGTTDPPPGVSAEHARVPVGLRDALVAAFNSGWKMRDSNGGFFADGRTAVPLQDGAASLVIDTGGRVTVGQWGRDLRMSRQVAAVRQNLDLVVDNGRPVAGLADNADGAWGSPKNQFQYTWRSGLGTDRSGNLIYLVGDQLNLAGLAAAMAAAGVQRGMELDIHPKEVAFNAFRPAAGQPFGLTGTKLLPAMVQPTTRYLVPDQRDFLAVTLRTTKR
jgi:phosphodiester glycosidase